MAISMLIPKEPTSLLPPSSTPSESVNSPAPSSSPSQSDHILLSKHEVFDALATRICKVIWVFRDSPIETSGCFIKSLSADRICVLTCFHDIKWSTVPIEIRYNSNIIKCQLPKKLDIHEAKKRDICILELESQPEVPFLELSDAPIEPKRGQKVYFAGFPLGQLQPYTHKAVISSLPAPSDPSKAFSIDGTVVHGHSGGPVVILKDNKIHLLGLISSQLVSITEKLMKTASTKLPQIRAYNDPSPSFGDTDVCNALMEIITNFHSNISTGLGKVTSIDNLSSIYKSAKSVTAPEYLSLIRDINENFSRIVSELPMHGTLQARAQSSEEVYRFPKRDMEDVMSFLEEIEKSSRKKEEFYSKCFGNPGTIYRRNNWRLDIQNPTSNDSTNLQFQIGSISIATVLIKNSLSSYTDKHKIRELVNYTIHVFKGAINRYSDSGDAVVIEISPKSSHD